MTLQRLTGRVFAGNANLTDLGVFGSALSGTPTNPTSTDTEAQIQANAAYEEGWTSAVVTTKNFPPIEEVNGVLRTISYQNCYLLQEGVPAYDSSTTYSSTSIVKEVSGNELKFYISKQDNNINHSLTDSDWWSQAIFTGSAPIGSPQITLNFNLVNAPANCVWLEGQIENISDYPQLYAIYGTAYNVDASSIGDGQFQFPNFKNYVIQGGETAGYISAGLPNIKAAWAVDNSDWTSGAVYVSGSNNHGADGSSGYQRQAIFNASRSAATATQANGIYRDNCYTVQPPAIKVRVYTRYQ